MKEEDRIRLGDTVREETCGLEGIVEAMTDWLYGCRRISFRPFGNKDGQPFELVNFDEGQLKLIQRRGGAAVEEPVIKTPKDKGGPQNDRAALRR